MHSNCRLLPNHIVCNIILRNNMRRANTCDPALKLLKEEIISDIHKQNLWKEHIDSHLDHRHNTHILWKTIHVLSTIAPPPTLNISITFNKLFTNTQHTRQTDPLTEEQIQYKDITLHSPQLRSKRQ